MTIIKQEQRQRLDTRAGFGVLTAGILARGTVYARTTFKNKSSACPDQTELGSMTKTKKALNATQTMARAGKEGTKTKEKIT